MTDFSQKIFHANSEFKFSLTACDCEVDVTHPSKGVTNHTFRLYPKAEVIHYAYIAGRGLVSKKHEGALDGRAVLPDLLAIKDGNAETVKKFIEKHGFFLPLDLNEDNSIESEPLFGLINRLKATVSLMSAIGEPKTNYKKILALTLYLLLTPEIIIQFPNYEAPFPTCPHDVGRMWNGVYQIDGYSLRSEDVDYNIEDGFMVNDSVRPPETWLTTDEYHDAAGYENLDLSGVKSNLSFPKCCKSRFSFSACHRFFVSFLQRCG